MIFALGGSYINMVIDQIENAAAVSISCSMNQIEKHSEVVRNQPDV